MIPKTIHYCWFGRNPKPKLAEKCMRSWKKYCPDYEIMEWNEDNFELASAPLYVRQAYEAKRWAFVTDYVRLWAIYEHGGIYLDTDVELIKPLDDLLSLEGYMGFEGTHCVAIGLGFGAEKGNQIVEKLLKNYWALNFILEDGVLWTRPAPLIHSPLLEQMGVRLDGSMQKIGNFVFFPNEYFCPLDNSTLLLHKTKNTYSIHWYAASWLNEDEKKKRKHLKFKLTCYRILTGMIGKENYEKVRKKIMG